MKKMLKYISGMLFLLITLSSCEDFILGDDFLEKRTSTDVTIDEVYSQKVYAEQALAQVYHSLPQGLITDGRLGWLTLESITDLASSHKSGSMVDYFGSNDASSDITKAVYRLDDDKNGRGPISGIRNAWSYIENVDRVPDMTDEEKAIRKAEAKLIIAYHNSQMLRYYGGMPWINKAYKPTDEFKFERLPVAQYVDSIVGLLDQAAEDLPWTVSAQDDGRMTKAAAIGLKVRVLLFAASPLFNSDQPYEPGEAAEKKVVWYGNYDAQRWQRVVDAGMDFMQAKQDNGYWELVNTGNPRQDFQTAYFERGNGETLISSRWYITWEKNVWEFAQIRYGVSTPNLNLVDYFPMADGSDFDWNNPLHAANPFFLNGQMVRDVRLYETCVVNEDEFAGRQAECYVGGREFRTNNWVRYTAFGMRKFMMDRQSNNGRFSQFPLLRLPEVYLSIAEALNELERSSEAIQYVNLVRNRVGLPGLAIGMTKSELREAILRERILEFAYEEVRYFDLQRWKRQDIWETTAELKALEIQKDGSSYTYTHVPVQNVRPSMNNWENKYYLTPIPVDEVNKKYGLIQNPGW